MKPLVVFTALLATFVIALAALEIANQRWMSKPIVVDASKLSKYGIAVNAEPYTPTIPAPWPLRPKPNVAHPDLARWRDL